MAGHVQAMRHSAALWECMPLQSESLDTSAIERNIGKKQSKHWLKARSIYSMYGIPDLAELQILFFTGRLLHLRTSLVSGSEFRGVPWSQRMLEWDRVRRSLGCWWTELVYKGFDVRKNFTLARCLSQAPTESDPQSGSPAENNDVLPWSAGEAGQQKKVMRRRGRQGREEGK